MKHVVQGLLEFTKFKKSIQWQIAVETGTFWKPTSLGPETSFQEIKLSVDVRKEVHINFG